MAGGAFLLLLALIGLCMPSPQSMAQDNDDCQRKLYAESHSRLVVDESKITAYRLRAEFYRCATAALQAIGFRRLADYVIPDIEAAMPMARSVLRAFLSSDGTIMGAVYDVRFSGWMRLLQWIHVLPWNLNVIEMETELSDGTFVITSAASLASKTTEVPGIFREFLPTESSAADILEAHRTHLARTLSKSPRSGICAIVMRTMEDLSASQDRQQRIKSRFRNSSAFDPASEMERIAGKPLTPEQRPLAEHARELQARRVNDSAARD
jgi:hypothetical protein